MRKITINLTTTEKLLSKLIRVVQGTDFSHSRVDFHSKYYDTELVYEAKGLNSYVMNKEHVDGIIIHSFETELSDEKYHELMKYVFSEIGTPYAWKELFGYLFIKIARICGIKIKNPWPQTGKICSESCGEILVRFFGTTPDVGYDEMDLVWLYNKLIEHPDFKLKGN